MAKSKSGGTRTYIRGRVGSDVYSIGRDAKGKKQQVVRSLAESVSNPQTQAQMRGRMIMSTVAQAAAALRPIVDHSFDNVVGSRANLSEFTSRNYARIKSDVASHPSVNNKFGLVLYGEKGAKQGAYIISDGQAALPTALAITKADGALAITLPADNLTIGGLKSALGMTTDEFFTLVGLSQAGAALYERFRVNPNLSADTEIAAGNINDVFAIEGNAVAVIAIASNVITITQAAIAGCCSVIISKKVAGGYIHNKATLGAGEGFANSADVALPTYPVGAQNYLNGGDIYGMSEQNGVAPVEPEPAPEPSNTAILSIAKTGTGTATVKKDGVNVTSGSAVEIGAQLDIEIVPATGQVPTATIAGTSITLTLSGSKYVGQATMPSSAATLTINTGTSDGGGGDDYDPNA